MMMHEIQTVIECNDSVTTAYLVGAQSIERRTDQQPPSEKALLLGEIQLVIQCGFDRQHSSDSVAGWSLQVTNADH